MKKVKLLILALLIQGTLLHSFAGQKDRFIQIYTGYQVKRTIPIILSLETELRYGNAYEFFLEGATTYKKCETHNKVDRKSFFDYKRLGVGTAYKGVISKGKNSLFRYRIGGQLGVRDHGFQTGLTLGFEYNLYSRKRLNLYILQKNDVFFFTQDHFFSGLLLGIKYRL